MTTRDCAVCQKEFTGAHRRCDTCRRGTHLCVDCSQPVGSRWRERCEPCQRKALTKPCLGCGVTIAPMSPAYKFCTAECRVAFYAAPSPDPVLCLPLKTKAEQLATIRARHAERVASDPEFVAARKAASRAAHLRRAHGVTEAEILRMVEQQGGCAICHIPAPDGAKGWHIDHDHNCCPVGKSCDKCRRGILCHRCNSGLGLFLDRAELLDAAAAYLRGAPSWAAA